MNISFKLAVLSLESILLSKDLVMGPLFFQVLLTDCISIYECVLLVLGHHHQPFIKVISLIFHLLFKEIIFALQRLDLNFKLTIFQIMRNVFVVVVVIFVLLGV